MTIEDNVFVGHNVAFINDTYPRATNPDGELQTERDWKVDPTLIKKGASIGSGVDHSLQRHGGRERHRGSWKRRHQERSGQYRGGGETRPCVAYCF